MVSTLHGKKQFSHKGKQSVSHDTISTPAGGIRKRRFSIKRSLDSQLGSLHLSTTLSLSLTLPFELYTCVCVPAYVCAITRRARARDSCES